MDIREIQQKYAALGIGTLSAKAISEAISRSARQSGVSEIGFRSTPENATKYLYRSMWVDTDFRAKVLDIRKMDREDGRVKKIHGRTSRMAVRGGLKLNLPSKDKTILSAWKSFSKRLGLDRAEKLQSDFRGFMMEGNLAMQWVIDKEGRVCSAIRMPTETLLPNVNKNGQFDSASEAYFQHDLYSGKKVASFALWQLTLVRLTPDNFDDFGCFGRPYLDSSRSVWKKLDMTETDLVIRRRERAPLRTAHVLEGADEADLEKYRAQIEEDQTSITANYYLNRKGGVQTVQGDANLDQIADVAYLLDTFFAGAPAPKGLFGYSGELSRDILEDLKRDFFDEIDALQDTISIAYRAGFELDLLLQGINPDMDDFDVQFASRRTDTMNQRADLALKYQAMGVPYDIIWETAGLDPVKVLKRRKVQQQSRDPYPSDVNEDDFPEIKITPGNARKGESATSISNNLIFLCEF